MSDSEAQPPRADRILVQRKQATTPTFTPPTSTPLARSSTPQPTAAPPQTVTEVQSSSQEVQSASGKQETPDLQAQLERAARFGHHFSRISVHCPQAKLAASQSGPPKQPEKVADQVLRLPAPKPLLRPLSQSQVQAHVIQPKLTIGQPGDQYEQEADRVADQVMAHPPSIQRQDKEEEAVQMQPLANLTPVIQRQVGLEESLQTKRSLQTDNSSQASSNLENQLRGTKGGGNSLPEEVRDFMEPRIGADFSQVRVHTDSSAVQMNKELNAQAFTHGHDVYFGAGKYNPGYGHDVYFGAGKYNPGSSDGKQLLAHELTHVVQQTGAKKLQRKPITSLLSNKETPHPKVQPASLESLPDSAIQRFKDNSQPQAPKDNKADTAEKASTASPTATRLSKMSKLVSLNSMERSSKPSTKALLTLSRLSRITLDNVWKPTRTSATAGWMVPHFG